MIAKFKVQVDRKWRGVRYKQRVWVSLSTGGYFAVFKIHDYVVRDKRCWEYMESTPRCTMDEAIKDGLLDRYDHSVAVAEYWHCRAKERTMRIKLKGAASHARS